MRSRFTLYKPFQSMLRKALVLSMSLALCWTTLGCGNSTLSDARTNPQSDRPAATSQSPTRIPDGQYGVQQATFDDGSGDYSVMLLNAPAGVSSMFRSDNLKLAQLTPEEVKANQRAYLKVENSEASLHIPEDFKIEYVHNVTETQTNPQTGRSETVVVRQEPSFWSPFAGSLAGSLAGQAIGSMLFRPQYYVPPAYQPGVPLSGFGGYGSSYGQAVNNYRERYNAAPVVERNRQTFRSTGRINSPNFNNNRNVNRPAVRNDRPTGSGYGTSTLRRSNRSTTPRVNRPSSFGSGRSSGVRSRRR
jgi:hypothetical protein